MKRVAVVFPGQGVQHVGMGRDVRALLGHLDETVGMELTALMSDGPASALVRTHCAQPAIVAVSLAYWGVLAEALGDVRPDFVAGHSVGEWAALCAAGAMDAREAVRIVGARGRAMDACVQTERGSMAAAIGGDRDAIMQLCARITTEVGFIAIANDNEPKQVVVSGTTDAIEAFAAQAKQCGVKRVIPLDVAGPFHTERMQCAVEHFAIALRGAVVAPMHTPIVLNCDAGIYMDSDFVRERLVQSIAMPVLWQQCVHTLVAAEVDTVIEVGPASVLAKLVAKIAPHMRTCTVTCVEEAHDVARQWREVCV